MILLNAGGGEPTPDFTPIAEWLGAANPEENFVMAFWVMYIIINLLSILVFNLGFARKLPILKNVVVYAVMFFGNMFITFFAFTMPIIESLMIAAVVLGIYKLRFRRHQQAEATDSQQ